MLSFARGVSLARLTTFGVGGCADYFAEILSEDDLCGAIDFARAKKIPICIVGAGSNMLISDEGFRGLVIRMMIPGFAHEVGEKSIRIFVGAGELWDDIVARTVTFGWCGMECLSGIPGTVGGAVVQNIGAYGSTLASHIITVRAYDLQEEAFIQYERDACKFEYRGSMFKRHTDRYIISRAIFELPKKKQPDLSSYHAVQNYFADWHQDVTLQDIRTAVLNIRRKKGTLMARGEEWLRSAGSFFKNPVVDQKKFHDLMEKIGERDRAEGPWFWRLSENAVKVAAAGLIEHIGFHKGYRIDGVGLSPLHTLAVVNYGGATASQITSFARKIQEDVFQEYGVILEPEVQCVGFDTYPFLKK